MEYKNGHVTDEVMTYTWPPKVLWGSMVIS